MEQTRELAPTDPAEKAAELYSRTLGDLPAFPPLAMRLAELAGSRDAQIDEITDLLRSDAAFSAELLRRANSPAYGFSARIDTLQQALVLLGFDELRRIALASAARSFTGPALQAPELRLCWRHSLAVALLAEELAHGTEVQPERAYTAGVMHDIGRLGLLTARPKEFAELLREAAAAGPIEDSSYFLEREAEVFGFDHTEAGRWLAQHWEIPLELRAVAGRHHDRPSDGPVGLLSLIQYAVLLADALGFGVLASSRGRDPAALREQAPPELRRVFDEDPARFEKMLRVRIDALDGGVSGSEEDSETEDAVVEEPQAVEEPAPAPATEPEEDTNEAADLEPSTDDLARAALPWAVGAVAALAAALTYFMLQG